MKYTWTITTKTMNTLTDEHRAMMFRMIYKLNAYYEDAEEHLDFSPVYTLLDAFRDIILSWPFNEYLAAYDELNEWTQSFMYGR